MLIENAEHQSESNREGTQSTLSHKRESSCSEEKFNEKEMGKQVGINLMGSQPTIQVRKQDREASQRARTPKSEQSIGASLRARARRPGENGTSGK